MYINILCIYNDKVYDIYIYIYIYNWLNNETNKVF